ncbi:guanine nucleotide-binding protein subunit beta-like protein 1 isoform X2 [Halyomorpha halys]|nr:guanine nucleotide-binding protein subunit beta-like protein 1 isoform X2 [Halyomorpha halys]
MPGPPPEPLYSFRGNMKSVHCILPVINETNELLYVGTNSGQVHVWDLKLKREKIKHEVGNEACLCITFNNNIFITQQKGESIKFWKENIEGVWKLQKILNHDYCGFCKMGLLDCFIILPSNGSSIALYDFVSNKEIIQAANKKLGEIMCLKVINSIKCILVCYESGILSLWNMDWSCLYETKVTEDCPMAIDYCDLTCEGILGTNNNRLLKFKLCDNKKISIVGEMNITNPGVSSVAINEKGKLCVIGCWDGRLRYYTMKKLKLLAVLTHHSGSIDDIVFVNLNLSFCDSGLVIAGGKDTKVSLWNLYCEYMNEFVKNKT